MDYIVFDAETDALLDDVTKIHCIVIYDSPSGQYQRFWDGWLGAKVSVMKQGDIADGVKAIREYAEAGYLIIGHNICGYDIPMFEKFGHKTVNPVMDSLQIYDSMIINNLMFPNEYPGLGYWGEKLGLSKPAIEDWSKLTPEVVDRCVQDVKINKKLFDFQIAKDSWNTTWDKARQLEQKVAYIHAQQTQHGIRVDVLKARKLYDEMTVKIDKLERTLHRKLPMTVVPTGKEVTKVFKADGTLSKQAKDWFKECSIAPLSGMVHHVSNPSLKFVRKDTVRVSGQFTRITFTPVNLNSHPKVKELLLSMGWKPTEYNRVRQLDGSWKTTSPKLTEDSYGSLPKGVGQEIAEFLKLQHRRRFILNETDRTRGLLAKVRSDGRIGADAFTCGTNTGRYRHTGAFVNLPKITTDYGPEIRSLFCVPEGRTLIGIDMDGIEARMTAHYTFPIDKGEYAKKVTGDKKLGLDIHTANAKALLCDRETAKTFLYALLYGAGEPKLASILGCKMAEASRRIKVFWRENHGIRKLIDSLEAEYTGVGYITGLDGRHLTVRGKHKLLNTLIQSAAAIVFKHWMVKCYEATNGAVTPWVKQILAYHDELAWEVDSSTPLVCKAIGNILARKVQEVAEDLEIKVTLEAQVQYGQKYSEVH